MTSVFSYQAGSLQCEGVPAAALAAEYDTPSYVYSEKAFIENYEDLLAAFAPLKPKVCFSVKSCQNLHILRRLAAAGSGFDVVSGGELHRALRAGAAPEQIVFAGVGKTDSEIRAALEARVGMFNVESLSELEALADIAQEVGATPDVAVRINPDVDAHTHEYTTTGTAENKFGVDLDHVRGMFERAAQRPSIRLRGLHVHIGSPITRVESYRDSIRQMLQVRNTLQADGFTIDALDLGGGLPVSYGDRGFPSVAEFAAAVRQPLLDSGAQVVLEPGRVIAANAGILLTRVLHVKQTGSRTFVVTDASMNELLRPSLYQAYHFVWPIQTDTPPASWAPEQPGDHHVICDVVGPICETADFLARQRALPPVQRGDVLAIFSTGAYAMTMASQYNSRPRPCEVLVNGAQHRLIRRRETYDDLLTAEESVSEEWQ